MSDSEEEGEYIELAPNAEGEYMEIFPSSDHDGKNSSGRKMDWLVPLASLVAFVVIVIVYCYACFGETDIFGVRHKEGYASSTAATPSTNKTNTFGGERK